MGITTIDLWYRELLFRIKAFGDRVEGRNGATLSSIDLPPSHFTETPLVTMRSTAWKRALQEMEWFLSGKAQCPAELADTWWRGQLNPQGRYYKGYGEQLRHYGYMYPGFDQIEHLVDGLRKHPNSRRLMLTTWHALDMAEITRVNMNPNTPTNCHSTIVQFSVREDGLHMTSYQRSADMLLGVPHNWIQSWALLLWLAHRAGGLRPASLRWIFGDAHIYLEASHIETVEAIMKAGNTAYVEDPPFEMVYDPEGDPTVFLASDFVLEGMIPKPVVTNKPRLL